MTLKTYKTATELDDLCILRSFLPTAFYAHCVLSRLILQVNLIEKNLIETLTFFIIFSSFSFFLSIKSSLPLENSHFHKFL